MKDKKMFKYLCVKIVASIPLTFFTLTQSHLTVIWGIVFIIIIDTFLGIRVALKHKKFKSEGLRRVIAKIGEYGAGMATAWIISCVSPSLMGWFFYATGSLIIVAEAISNFEKLGLLGNTWAVKLIAKINENYDNLLSPDKKELRKDSDEHAKKLIKS